MSGLVVARRALLYPTLDLERYLKSFKSLETLYTFRETQGLVAFDKGRARLDGTITGATIATFKGGKMGYSFDGVNDDVSNSKAAFDYTAVTDFTMMCLFNLTDALTFGTLTAIQTGDAAVNAYFYHISAELAWRIDKTGNLVRRQTTNTLSLVADTWYLGTLTKVGNDDVTVYLTKTVNTSRTDHVLDDGGQAASATRVGVNRSAVVQSFGKGVIALAAFFSDDLTSSDISRAVDLARV
jgi:hypothetical protein